MVIRQTDLIGKQNDNFGQSAANIGDLNDDGVNDLVVGAPSDNGAAHPSPMTVGQYTSCS